jgi:hypothetical protein
MPEVLQRFDAKVQVTGRVTQNGQGLGGVYLDSGQSMNGGDASCQVSQPDGYFACILPPNWTGRIVPVRAGLTFNPSEFTVKNLTRNLDNQNFEASKK